MNEFIPHKLEESKGQELHYQLSKELFSNKNYKHISNDAKLLYAILKDRNELSRKNNWADKEGHIYIIFTREEVGELLGCANQKVVKIFKELHDVKLIKEVRQGLNKANIIYVGKLSLESTDNSRKCENHISGSMKITFQEMCKSHTSNTNINNTYIMSNTTTTELEEKGCNNIILADAIINIDNQLQDKTKKLKENKEKVPVYNEPKLYKENEHKPDKAIVQEYKNKIDNITGGDIVADTVSKLIANHSTDTIDIYINNWSKFTAKKNSVGLFIGAIKNKYSIPKAPKVETVNNNRFMDIPQMHNFDQRDYTAEDFEKYYYKLPE